ncbi:MAG: sugar ABC transporter ATP-binding protein [Phycisphaerales bacterium]
MTHAARATRSTTGAIPRLRVEGITKRFGPTLALDNVSLTMEAGEVHALMGENGAGKSTLGKVIAGIHIPDAGRVEVDGDELPTGSVHVAAALGVRIVHQELAQCANLSVAENLCLHDLPTRLTGGAGRSPSGGGGRFAWLRSIAPVDRRAARERARRLLHDLDPTIEPDAPLGSLAPGRRQIVQIGAALDEAQSPARIIVFDEPTSSLSVVEADRLMSIVRRLAARGILCIYVSHRMKEIFTCCDRVTVLRDGRFVGTGTIGHDRPAPATSPARTALPSSAPPVDESTLVSWMIGRTLNASAPRRAASVAPRAAALASDSPALEVRDLHSPGKLRGVGLAARAGEIVGIGGLVGAGRSELLDAIFGLDPRASGSVAVAGRTLPRLAARDAIAAGIGYVPEDRRLQGLFFLLGVDENVVMPVMPQLASAGFRVLGRERDAFRAGVERFRIKTASPASPPGELSGGNQQKLLLARWMRESTRVLLLDEPTRGIDVGTKSEIHRLIISAADAGAAVILVSSEMPELLALSDRLLVLAEGRITGELTGAAMTQENILRLAVASAGAGPIAPPAEKAQ